MNSAGPIDRMVPEAGISSRSLAHDFHGGRHNPPPDAQLRGHSGSGLRLRGGISVLLLAICLWPATVHGGGGPENVLLVVNQNSESSLTVANHYIELRQLPPENVVYLDWQGGVESAEGEVFRTKILQPVLATMRRRDLAPHIDYIVYSTDFPWSLNLSSDYPQANGKLPAPLRPHVSLTSATYLWRMVTAKSRGVLSLASNYYVQKPDPRTNTTRSFGFRSTYQWGPQGERKDDGLNYMLSTMLGVTSGRGNTVPQVLSYLTRAKQADGTRPPGTIYYMENSNVRSTTRAGGFAGAVAELKRLDIKAEVVAGRIPERKIDVAGAMIGTASFDWSKSNSRILPGAICEHLTSFGGVLRKGAGQSPLTEFLKYGAAGSCGTVTEPFAIQAKFPLPTLHVHYARGCSLAESFYQSVSGPFQLLIVGDPLCQPWARFPEVTLAGLTSDESVSGVRKLTPRADVPGGADVDHFEMFIDGERSAAIRPGGSIELDTAMLDDGYHELRVVAFADSAIETQGRLIVPLLVDNHGARVSLTSERREVPAGQQLSLQAQAEGTKQIAIRHNGRTLATIEGSAGKATIDTAQLGRGTNQLQAVSKGEHPARSKPLKIVVR